jgi:hypothetical protein
MYEEIVFEIINFPDGTTISNLQIKKIRCGRPEKCWKY